jgi:hypothetical protein
MCVLTAGWSQPYGMHGVTPWCSLHMLSACLCSTAGNMCNEVSGAGTFAIAEDSGLNALQD